MRKERDRVRGNREMRKERDRVRVNTAKEQRDEERERQG